MPAAFGLESPSFWRRAGSFVMLVASGFFHAWREFVPLDPRRIADRGPQAPRPSTVRGNPVGGSD